MQQLLEILLSNKEIVQMMIGATIAIILFSIAPFRRTFQRLFVVIGDERESKKLTEELKDIKASLAQLQSEVSNVGVDALRDGVRHTLSANVYLQIQEMVDRHLKDLSERGDGVVRHLESEARETVRSLLKNIEIPELVREKLKIEDFDRRRENNEGFERLIDRQLSSANNTRAVMMNLFVAFNLTLLAVFSLMPDRFTDRSSLTILGVYVSLSAFIIYIYRASNARAASLLAIKEDEKKLSNVFDFLSAFKKTPAFSNNEVELVRALLINRIEREKGADHPYEVILKGVTNSNVLVRGGKVASSTAKKSET
jgi:ABC-type multidrug transport system fused ATPase/permease subunit